MASGDRYYCLTALPAPGDLGSAPPVTAEQLLEMVSGMRDVHRLLEALFLQDDLVQREAFLSGEVAEIEPAVLTLRQAKNEEPLRAIWLRLRSGTNWRDPRRWTISGKVFPARRGNGPPG